MGEHSRGERPLLLERAEEIEVERLAGKEVGPKSLGIDDSANLAVGELAADERDERGIDEVGTRAGNRGRETAAEAAPASGDLVVPTAAGVALAFTPQRLGEPRHGAEAGVPNIVAVVP